MTASGHRGRIRLSTGRAASTGSVLFVVLLPGNVYAAVEGIEFAGDPATPLWQRIPEQVLYIAVALVAATDRQPAPVDRERTHASATA